VVGRGLVVLPWHQRDAGSLRHRSRQRREREHDRHAQRPRRAAPAREPLGETDGWVVLFTSHATWRAAGASYRRRWATEGSYRDAQGGWDGHHGWDLEAVAAGLPSGAKVAQVVGLWALGTVLQTWVGHQVGLTTAPPLVREALGQWTTTGRLSVWARGRLALTEPSGCLHDWLRSTLAAGAAHLATSPHPVPAVLPLPSPRRRTTRKVA
jgi:hypothetical protein